MAEENISSGSSTSVNTILSSSHPSLSSLNQAHHFLSLKLTPKNFLFWKTQLLPFLRGQDLLGYIDGSVPCPPSTIVVDGQTAPQPNPAHSFWVRQDQLIMSLLISSLSEEVLSLVVGLPSSLAVWSALEAAFASPSHTRILTIHMDLQNLRQRDSTVGSYLQRAKALADELAATGQALNPIDFNIYIFKGLRPEFKDLVTTLSTHPKPVSFSELHGFLLSHEFLNKESFSSLTISPTSFDPPPSAHFTHQGGSSSSSCGRSRFHRGHGRGPSGRNFGSSSTSDLRPCCQICNGNNHQASICYHHYS